MTRLMSKLNDNHKYGGLEALPIMINELTTGCRGPPALNLNGISMGKCRTIKVKLFHAECLIMKLKFTNSSSTWRRIVVFAQFGFSLLLLNNRYSIGNSRPASIVLGNPEN